MRDLIRRSRPAELESIRSGIDQVFTDAFFRNWPLGSQEMFPSVDLYVAESNLVALINLPGAESKDVEVTATVDTLTVTGELKTAAAEGDLIWQERSGGKFYRSFKLPVHIKSDQVDASFKSGVLRIVMPKVDELKSRTVQIKEG
ncbi:MAG: Hsp20/alpha crystallin family protein [Dethiobacter sp.]|jgi:HSP20 family protein|nr:Hsp20/alpha crystallin family protein [Dethiobacter sp.]